MKSSISKHLVSLYTFILLIPLVYFIPPVIANTLNDNHFVVTVLSLVVIVPLVSYLALPLAINATLKWQDKKKAEQ